MQHVSEGAQSGAGYRQRPPFQRESHEGFETLRGGLQSRLDALYEKFHLENLREKTYKELVAQSPKRGTKEWTFLRLKSLQGIIRQAEVDDENAMQTADRLLKQWERIDDLENFFVSM